MNRTTLPTVAVTLALLLIASVATAQGTDTGQGPQENEFALTLPDVTAQNGVQTQSTVKGLSVGIHGATTAIGRRNTPAGSGLSLTLGYGVTDRLAVHLATSGARIGATSDRDSFFQSHVDMEGRYSFGRMNGQWMPHLAIGVSGRTVHNERPVEEGGGTKVRMTIRPTTGGGVSYFLSRSTSLDASVRYTFGDAQRTRAFFGVSWYPRTR